ncbi:MAG: hypothetical protein ACFFBD_08710 [Candidatus Hodarchaeota archaeon]
MSEIQQLSYLALEKFRDERYSDAKELFEQLIPRFKQDDDKVEMAFAITGQALCLEKLGKLKEAADLYLTAAQTLKDVWITSEVFNWYKKAAHLNPELEEDVKRWIMEIGGIDVAIMYDTTGSMYSYVGSINEAILGLLDTFKALGLLLRCGVVDFRDHADRDRTYMMRTHLLTDDFDTLAEFVKKTQSGGGAGNAAICDVLKYMNDEYSWENVDRICLLIGDAPVSECIYGLSLEDEIETINRSDVRIHTILCGSDSRTEKIWKDISKKTNGTFFQVSSGSEIIALLPAIALTVINQSELVDDSHISESNQKALQSLEGC